MVFEDMKGPHSHDLGTDHIGLLFGRNDQICHNPCIVDPFDNDNGNDHIAHPLSQDSNSSK